MSIYEQLLAAGVEIANHESDLYCPVNEVTRPIVAAYEYRTNVTTFRNQLNGEIWYDIPFAYLPFWDKAVKAAKAANPSNSYAAS